MQLIHKALAVGIVAVFLLATVPMTVNAAPFDVQQALRNILTGVNSVKEDTTDIKDQLAANTDNLSRIQDWIAQRTYSGSGHRVEQLEGAQGLKRGDIIVGAGACVITVTVTVESYTLEGSGVNLFFYNNGQWQGILFPADTTEPQTQTFVYVLSPEPPFPENVLLQMPAFYADGPTGTVVEWSWTYTVQF